MPRALCIYLLAFGALAQIQQAPPTPPGKGSIEGIVSDAASHEPLKKAQVSLTGSIATPLTAVTDAGGRFAFRELAAGNYFLNALKSGYNVPQSILGIGVTHIVPGIVLGEDEQKKNVEISLMPGGTISGRVVNEEGAPVRGCAVAAIEPTYEQNRRGLRSVSGAATNDNGGYRLHNVAPGSYYVFAHCHAQLPVPHPLLARGDPRTPHETYLPQFYGGGLDPSTATKLTLAPGASLEGADFRLTRVPAFTLRGSITGSDPEALAGPVNILLFPANRLMRDLMPAGASTDPPGNKFQIQSVIPGSYLLFAYRMIDGNGLIGQRTVEVGAAPPDPLEISLTSGSELKGSVQFDCDDHPPLENAQLLLAPLDTVLYVQQRQTQIDNSGAFTLTGVMPGRSNLSVLGEGYVKSVTLGAQQVSPYGLQIGAGATGPLRIVMGCKLARLSVSVTGAPDGGQVSALIFPEDPDHFGRGQERVGSATGAAQIEFGGLPPGRYRVFATDIGNPWPLLQRPDVLKALESRTAVIEVPEGGHATTKVEVIAREELMRVLEEKE